MKLSIVSAFLGLTLIAINPVQAENHELEGGVAPKSNDGVTLVHVDNETNRVRIVKVDEVPEAVRNHSIKKMDKEAQEAYLKEAIESADVVETISDFVLSKDDLAKMANGELEGTDGSTASCFFNRWRGCYPCYSYCSPVYYYAAPAYVAYPSYWYAAPVWGYGYAGCGYSYTWGGYGFGCGYYW